ncbi:MAG: DUF1579 family protein [Planctomycetaceae bacterium]
MRRDTSTFMVCLAVWAVTFARTVSAEEPIGEPDPGVKELALLHRMSGRWVTQLDNSDVKVSGGRRWILDGKFLHQDFNTSNGTLRGTITRGYDQKRHHYTMTYLDNQGNAALLTGVWNEDQKMLTFDTNDRQSYMQKFELYFPDDNTEQWTVEVQGENELIRVTGIARRQP